MLASRAILPGVLAGIVAAAGSCAPTRDTDRIATEPGDLLVTAIVGSDDCVIAAKLIPAGGVVPYAVPSGGSAVFWRLRPSELIGPDGQPLPQAMLDGLSVRVVSACVPAEEPPAGSCNRCLSTQPDGTTPYLVHPGSSCPPPSSTAIDVDARLPAEKHRLSLRLEWPGPCACAAPQEVASPTFDVSLARAEGDPPLEEMLPFFTSARSSSGTIALVWPGVTLLEPDGAIRIQQSTLPNNELPMILEGLLGDAFFSIEEPFGVAVPSVDGFELNGQGTGSAFPVRVPDPISASTSLRLPGTNRLILLGRTLTQASAALVCEDLGGWLCRYLLKHVLGNDTFIDAVLLPDGVVVTATRDGALMTLGEIPPVAGLEERFELRQTLSSTAGQVFDGVSLTTGGPIPWRAVKLGQMPPPFERLSLQAVRHLGHLGNRVFACAQLYDPEPGKGGSEVLMSRVIDRAGLDTPGSLTTERQWDVVYCGGFAPHCTGLIPAADGSSIDAYFSDGQRVRLGRDGLPIGLPLQAACTGEGTTRSPGELPGVVQSVDDEDPSRLLITTRDLRLFTRTATGAYRQLYGQRAPPGGLILAAAAIDDVMYGFGPEGRMVVAPRSADLHRTGTVDRAGFESPWLDDPNGQVVAALALENGGAHEVLLAGFGSGQGWVQRLRVAGTSAVLLGAPIALRLDGAPAIPTDAGLAAPGVAVIAVQRLDLVGMRDPFGLLRLRGDRLDPIRIELTDAQSGWRWVPPVRTPQDLHICPYRFPPDVLFIPGANLGGVRALDARDGVAWGVGCDGLVLRIWPLAEPPVAQAYDYLLRSGNHTSFADLRLAPDFSEVKAMCPDQILFSAASVETSFFSNESLLWRTDAPELEVDEEKVLYVQTPSSLFVEPRIRPVVSGAQDVSIALESGPLHHLLSNGRSIVSIYAAQGDKSVPGSAQPWGATRRVRSAERLGAGVLWPDASGLPEVQIFTDSSRILRLDLK